MRLNDVDLRVKMTRGLFLLPVYLMVGCSGGAPLKDDSKPPIDSGVIQVGDEDQDGVAEADGDCDDENPDIHPGRAEDCNAIDDNCNGLVDEGYPDSDVDGIADCQDTEECDGLDNDGDGDVDEGYPDSDFDGLADCVGEERCDGQDNDGDGEVDEGFDQDGDGVTSCEGDCDDTNALAAPGV